MKYFCRLAVVCEPGALERQHPVEQRQQSVQRASDPQFWAAQSRTAKQVEAASMFTIQIQSTYITYSSVNCQSSFGDAD